MVIVGHIGPGTTTALSSIMKDRKDVTVIENEKKKEKERGIELTTDQPYIITARPNYSAAVQILKEPKNYITGKKLPKLNKNKKRKK